MEWGIMKRNLYTRQFGKEPSQSIAHLTQRNEVIET